MTKLEQAALSLLAHWDTPAWKQQKPTADLMGDLRAALAEQGCDYCNSPLFAGTSCPNCGRVVEPDHIADAGNKVPDHIADADKMVREPVAVVDANDDGYWADILPDRSVKVGQKLYAAPVEPVKQEPVATHICNLWVDPITKEYVVDHCDHPIDELIPAYAAPVHAKDLTDFGCVPNSNGTTNQRGELLSALEALLEDYIHRVQDAWIEAGGSDISREEVLTNCEPARNAAAAIANMTGATDELP